DQDTVGNGCGKVLTKKILCSILLPKRHTGGACGPGQRRSPSGWSPVTTTRIVPSVPTALPETPRCGVEVHRHDPPPRARARVQGSRTRSVGPHARFPSVHTRTEPNTFRSSTIYSRLPTPDF